MAAWSVSALQSGLSQLLLLALLPATASAVAGAAAAAEGAHCTAAAGAAAVCCTGCCVQLASVTVRLHCRHTALLALRMTLQMSQRLQDL
jgi:hypothetical protein